MQLQQLVYLSRSDLLPLESSYCKPLCPRIYSAVPEVLCSACRDREGAVRSFMAAANTLQTAQIFAQCAVEVPRIPDKIGAMDLFRAYQKAAQAVEELDKAVREHPSQADMQGESSNPA